MGEGWRGNTPTKILRSPVGWEGIEYRYHQHLSKNMRQPIGVVSNSQEVFCKHWSLFISLACPQYICNDGERRAIFHCREHITHGESSSECTSAPAPQLLYQPNIYHSPKGPLGDWNQVKATVRTILQTIRLPS